MNYRTKEEVNNPKFQNQVANGIRDIQISGEMSRGNLFRKYGNDNVVDNVAMRSQQELSSMHNAGRVMTGRGKDPISSKIISDAKERLKLLRKYHSNSAQRNKLSRARAKDRKTGNISGKRVVEEAKNLGRKAIPEITNYVGEKINPIDWISSKIKSKKGGINLKKGRERDHRFRDEVGHLATGAFVSAVKNQAYNHTD